ncbi:MAG: AAA family ATPase, partial [Armatimonadota bacterium]
MNSSNTPDNTRPLSMEDITRKVFTPVDPKPPQPHADPLLDGIQITDEYRLVERLLRADEPVVFVTGNAGTGKSTLIRYLKSVLEKNIVVVAPTGVAALNAEGVTIHSFFRLPPRIHEQDDIKRLFNRKVYQKLELLIIDEVSMVR